MKITIKREDFLNSIKLVEKICAPKGVLSNILIETISNDRVRFYATDMNLSIAATTQADVSEGGAITLPAKKISEIVLKLPEKPIEMDLNPETNMVTIKCSNSKYELLGMKASDFSKNLDPDTLDKENGIKIEIKPFIKAVKQTAFASAGHESNSVLSGVFCSIQPDALEMAATDGNRLTRIIEKIDNTNTEEKSFIIPSKTLHEVQRISSLIDDKEFTVLLEKSKIIFLSEDVILSSGLLEGTYPKYQQLIPQSCERTAAVNREDLIKAIERASVMVNERTNIVKFIFNEKTLELKADTPDSGNCEESIDVEFEGEELIIAFNYRFVSEALNAMDSSEVNIGLSGSLSATIFKPKNEQDYICLIMPVQVR